MWAEYEMKTAALLNVAGGGESVLMVAGARLSNYMHLPILAIDIIEDMAPQYASFRALEQMEPEKLSPAPYPVKSIYSSYPALYFPDYIRALRAAGDTGGANNMLNHLEAILQWRRARGLLVEERHVAEARALRGDYEGALNALEQALKDRTIFHGWHVFLLHNPIFADIRERPRFMAIVGQVRDEVQRQRAELNASIGRASSHH